MAVEQRDDGFDVSSELSTSVLSAPGRWERGDIIDQASKVDKNA